MTKICGIRCIAAACCCTLFSCSIFKTTRQAKNLAFPEIKTDASYKPPSKSAYEKIVHKAIARQGLFTIYQKEDNIYFAIPDSILNKDILIVNRISKAATQVRPNHAYAGYGADQIGESVVRFCKGAGNKIFLQKMEYAGSRSADSSENGMFRAVLNSNLQPIVAAFDIKGYAPDSSAILIDMTDFISNDNELFFFSGQQKKMYNLGNLQSDRSYVRQVNAFPLNIEIKTVKTFSNGNSGMAQTLPFLTYELNTSIVLLPQIPMKTRNVDERVGYFGRGYVDFDIPHPQGFNGSWLATRWRLEPKEEDIEKYNKGELVEPKKPIVFYIDPATPKKWVSFLINGVNAWQKAFEQAGFKNAIYALEAPVNDPEWSLEDTRHSAIVYKASWIQNASGPTVNDPRTGEILEAHINWYHNITEILHDWYFTQAAASDTAARKMIFNDSLMGRLITYVCTHEVGHTLGLAHNFAASSATPTDSLRNRTWVEANGIASSIMDYARFNYVAQPEDSIGEKGLIGQVGAYDKWAIEWGYRWRADFNTPAAEKELLNKWVTEKLNNPALLFAWSGASCQTEDLGDDAVKASHYGILNLKRILPQLVSWSTLPNENYDGTVKMEQQLISQFRTYLGHVTEIVGGRYETPKTAGQKGNVLDYIPAKKQQAALQFLQREIFTTPAWLLNNNIAAITGGIGAGGILSVQQEVLGNLMSPQKINRLLYYQALQPATAYTPNQLFTDLETGIWTELQGHQPIGIYRRNLQKSYVTKLLDLQHVAGGSLAGMYSTNLSMSDLLSVVKAHRKQLLKKIEQNIIACKDADTRWHLTDLAERLKNPGSGDEQEFNKKGGTDAVMAKDVQYNLTDKMPSYESIMQAPPGDCFTHLR